MSNQKPTNETAIVPQQVSYELANWKQIEELTVERAKAELWPDAPISEIRKVVHIAQARGANPWCQEIYLIKRREKLPNGQYTDRWVVQMGQNYVVKVAAAHPQCDGWQDGVIVQDKDGRIEQLKGDFLPKGWTLVGAWFQGYRKGWKVPVTKRVNLEDYSTGMSTWKKLSATMIVKVARTQGLRQMLPDRLSGMYDSAEMDQMGEIAEGELVSTAKLTDVPPPPALPQTEIKAAKNAPKRNEADEEIIQQLRAIIMTIADNDIAAAKTILKEWSGKSGISLTTDPRLKGQTLQNIFNRATEEWQGWLEQNPDAAAELRGDDVPHDEQEDPPQE